MTKGPAGTMLAALVLCAWETGACAQTYRNVLNTRFRTVANGPMQALVVDVPRGADSATAWRTVADRLTTVRRARSASVRRQIEALRRVFPGRRLTPAVPDIVLMRESGRLARGTVTRAGRAPNDIEFDLPATGSGSWTTAQAAELASLVQILYPILKSTYGDPSWSGHVTVLNGDNMSPIIGDPDAVSGGVYNVSAKQIVFAQFNSPQTKVLSLTQMMAIAFHGDASVSFDAWERGMARAATIMTVSAALPQLEATYGAGAIDVADPLWTAFDRYDLLNQPALGNDRFYPASKATGEANTVTFPNMLIPRLVMAGTAWQKVGTTDPTFFRTFNTAYYAAAAANPGIREDVPALRNLAQQALTTDGVATVEGLTFPLWFEQQYVLDTSVTQGEKLYALVSALRPQAAADDDYAVGIVVYYYRTSATASGDSDETNLNGAIFPVYWDNTYTSRLFLAGQYERIDITGGLGTVAPTFLNTIGGDPAQEGRMRITIELPINGQVVRLHVAPRSMGKLGAVNNFWGTVVGADTGTIKLETEGGTSIELPVVQGAFGGAANAQGFARRSRSTVTFTPTGGTPTVRNVVTGPGEFAAVVYAASNLGTVTQTLPRGLSMVSFPVRPSRAKATEALLSPTTSQPLFTDDTLLMAHWRQNLTTVSKYEFYPAMEPIQPGVGYWINLAADTPLKLTGTVLTAEPFFSLGLTYGWNQIGSPYSGIIDTSNLRFQYLADNIPVTLAQAVARGWIEAPTIPGAGTAAVWRYTSDRGYQPASAMEAWFGYWIRVLVSEGLTITFPNPNGPTAPQATARSASAAAPRASAATDPGAGWSVLLSLRGSDGLGASAVLGQVEGAAVGFDRTHDALLPPSPVRSTPFLAFPHADWGANAGDYYADIRPGGAPTSSWTIAATTPAPNGTYTLSWSYLRNLPRSVRLVLTDLASGHRQYMQTSSGYTFAQSTSGSRQFRIDMERRDRSSLRITALNARATRAAGSRTVQIGYQLSQGATVETRIRSADGRVIRTLSPGRAAMSGANSALWDTRDDRAISVPSGMYLVEVSARTPEGDAARVVVPVTVVR